MDKYAGVTDEQLLERLRGGEEEVMDYILEKYKYLVRKRAKDMYMIGADGEDLIQEGMIGLFKAVRDYDGTRQASFGSFADLCVSRQMYSAVRASNRMKHMPLNTYISLYARADGREAGCEDAVLIEQLHSLRVDDPENAVIAAENVNELRTHLLKCLSKLELEVMLLYLAGNDYAQIARMTGKTPKSVDNALHRARVKMTTDVYSV